MSTKAFTIVLLCRDDAADKANKNQLRIKG
jgi:hypothetical protein